MPATRAPRASGGHSNGSPRTSRAFLQSVIDAVPETILVLDREYRIVLANQAAARQAGGKDPVATCMKCHGLSHHRKLLCEGEQDPCPLKEVLRTGAPVVVTHRHLDADGNESDVEITASPIFDKSGKVVHVIEACRDVTERIRSEHTLRETSAELARSNRDLQQFASIASHDLKAPLRAVSGFLDLLQRSAGDKLDAAARHYVERALEGAARMDRLIGDLLEYSRAGTQGLAYTRVHVGEVLRRVLDNLAPAVGEAGAVVTREELPAVVADDGLLTRLFQNLLSNAMKYRDAARPCEIHVGAERREGGWLFRVRDSGIGIAPKDAERIFDIFVRLHGPDKYPGTGIGLAICKRIVERHGGRIWVESRPGAGSTFCFALPDRTAGEGPPATP
jgi:PAS domain S-box-containing protein